ncbi:N-acetylmuramoyl-L-alanine amidase, partial [Psychromonas aquatilis]
LRPWMEKNEAQSEFLGGAGNIIEGSDSVPILNKMLLDMSMGNTMGVGYNIGSLVTNELSKVTKMHKKEPVHA